jgi:riboflavin transporter FmnP
MNSKTKRITVIGMLSAVAYIFTLIGHFVPIAFNDFLKYDPKDAIIVIAGLSLGPVASLIISVVVALLELVTISTTGPIGCLMNIISSASYACVASLIYKKFRSIKGAIAGLTVSSVLTVALMLLWNYFVTPLYMGAPREVIEAMLLPVFLPFNVIKCGLNTALTLLIYKPCVKAMRQIGLLQGNEQGKDNKKSVISPLIIVLSFVLIALMILLYILLG